MFYSVCLTIYIKHFTLHILHCPVSGIAPCIERDYMLQNLRLPPGCHPELHYTVLYYNVLHWTPLNIVIYCIFLYCSGYFDTSRPADRLYMVGGGGRTGRESTLGGRSHQTALSTPSISKYRSKWIPNRPSCRVYCYHGKLLNFPLLPVPCYRRTILGWFWPSNMFQHFSFSDISVKVTYQFQWHFSFSNISISVIFQFHWQFSFSDISVSVTLQL